MPKLSMILAVMIAFLLPAVGLAEPLETEKIIIPEDDIESLQIEGDFGVGYFEITTADMKEIARGDIEYAPRQVEIFSEYDRHGEKGYLRLGSEYRRSRDIDTDDNHWSLTLSTRYVTELVADFGACEASLDLGGLPLEYLEFDIGAADAELTFGSPNPTVIDRIDIDAGAASFRADKLGNARFRRLYFDGGVGKFELSFDGDFREKATAHIDIGLGSAVIRIPADLPVRLDAPSSFLSSVEFEDDGGGEFDDDGFYESGDFRSSETGLELIISVGLGTVEIIRGE